MTRAPRVLVVDDSTVARLAVVRKLRARGVEVVEQASAADGSSSPLDGVDAAILDLELGDGTGVDVARALRARAPSLPLAFFTSEPAAKLAERARAVARVFAKPAELDDLVDFMLAALTPRSS